MMKLARLTVWTLRITAALIYLYHFLYWPLANACITHSEVFLRKWPWLTVSIGMVVAGEVIDVGMRRQWKGEDGAGGE